MKEIALITTKFEKNLWSVYEGQTALGLFFTKDSPLVGFDLL